jgi:hypothetical protein
VTRTVLKTQETLEKSGAKAIDDQRLRGARLQHVGYVTGQLSRTAELELPKELTRAIMRSYFAGELKPTRTDTEAATPDAMSTETQARGEGKESIDAGLLTEQFDQLPEGPAKELARIFLQGEVKPEDEKAFDPREYLAEELSELPDRSAAKDAVKKFVLSSDNDSLFSRDSLHTPEGLLSNLAAESAGEMTLEFAAHLVGDERAASFIREVFALSNTELLQLCGAPKGKEGALLHFAAMAHHLAWTTSKLASGVTTHENLVPTTQILLGDKEAALKLGDQMESFLLARQKIVPLDKQNSSFSLSGLLRDVRRQGIYSERHLRMISDGAIEVADRLTEGMQQASRVGDWTMGAEYAVDLVANVAAAFAAQATGANYDEDAQRLLMFQHSLKQFLPELKRLEEAGELRKGEAAYKQLYSDWSGRFGLQALKSENGLGDAAAGTVVRDVTAAHFIPQAVNALQLPNRQDFTAKNLISDLHELKSGLLHKDYFLQQESFLSFVEAEIARGSNATVNPEHLELAVRIPNEMWMFLVLIRGLVENKLERLKGGMADRGSDTFPDNAQLNPPDIRDVEIFNWARARLAPTEGEEKATRMALAVVVLTLYKDVYELKKAQGIVPLE